MRERLIFSSLEDVKRCLQRIADDSNLRIVSIKNRYDSLAPVHRTAGYRDVTLVLLVVNELTDAIGVSGHGCELQLAHRDLEALISPDQHERYLAYKNVSQFKRNGTLFKGLVARLRTSKTASSRLDARSKSSTLNPKP